MKDYMVITEIHSEKGTERWYYGTYDRDRANEVAIELGGEYPIYHCVIDTKDAEKMGVLNLPLIRG